jgi:hypothetical protein
MRRPIAKKPLSSVINSFSKIGASIVISLANVIAS